MANLMDVVVSISARDDASSRIRQVSETARNSFGGVEQSTNRVNNAFGLLARGASTISNAITGTSRVSSAARTVFSGLSNGLTTLSGRFTQSSGEGQRWSGSLGASFSSLVKGSAAFTLAQSAVSAGFNLIQQSVGAAVTRLDTLNQFPKVMQNLGIDSDAAKAAISRLSDGIDGLPTTLDAAANGVTRFVSKNSDIDKSTTYFLAMNDAIVAGGASAEIQSSAVEQLSQSYSKGKMDMMEWRTLQMAMPAQLNQVAAAMGMTTDALGEGLRSGQVSMDSFMDTLVQLDTQGVNGLASFHDQALSATGGIATSFTNLKTSVVKSVASVLDAINGPEGRISGAFNTIKSGISAFTNEAIPKIQEFINALAEGYNTYLKPAIDGMMEAFGNLKRVLDETTIGGESLGTIIANILIAALTALATIITIVVTAITIAIEVIATIINAVVEFVTAIIEGIATLGTLPEFIMNLWNMLVMLFTQGILAIITGVTQLVTDIVTFFTTLWTTIVTIVTTIWTNVVTLFTTGIQLIVAAVTAWVASLIAFFTNLWNTAVSIVTNLWNSIKSMFSSSISAVQSVVSGWVAVIVGFFTNLWNTAVSIVTNLWNTAVNLFNAGVTNAQNFVSNLVSGVIGFFSNLFSSVTSTASNIWSNVTSAFSSGVSNAINYVSQLPSKIMSFFSNAGSWLINAGHNIIQGLINGIRNAAGGLIGALTGAVDNAINAAKAALGIASPSKVFKKIGLNTMEGLAIGVENAEDEPAIAVNHAINGMIQSPVIDVTSGKSETVQAIERLQSNLGRIIAAYAPAATPREFGRMVRNVQ